MNNILLDISYDGSNYSGFQIQPDRITIEGEITNALRNVLGEYIIIYGSGRTDSGVHAISQKANFLTSKDIDLERLPHAINHFLDKDIRINKAIKVDENFHARYNAKKKTYKYIIYNDKIFSPFYIGRAWHVFHDLDFDIMLKAANDLIGTHDFLGFSLNDNVSVKTSVRTIYDIKLTKEDKIITFEITGSGFLYNMVRKIIGALVDIARGKLPQNKIEEVLHKRGNEKITFTAPAHGLYLKEIFYEEYQEIVDF